MNANHREKSEADPSEEDQFGMPTLKIVRSMLNGASVYSHHHVNEMNGRRARGRRAWSGQSSAGGDFAR